VLCRCLVLALALWLASTAPAQTGVTTEPAEPFVPDRYVVIFDEPASVRSVSHESTALRYAPAKFRLDGDVELYMALAEQRFVLPCLQPPYRGACDDELKLLMQDPTFRVHCIHAIGSQLGFGPGAPSFRLQCAIVKRCLVLLRVDPDYVVRSSIVELLERADPALVAAAQRASTDTVEHPSKNDGYRRPLERDRTR